MKKFVTPLIIFVGTTALIGCGAGSKGSYDPKPVAAVTSKKLEAGQESQLLPVKEGNQWVYETTVATQGGNGQQSTNNGILTFEVGKVTPTADGVQFQMNVLNEGERTEQQIWAISKRGIFLISALVKAKPTDAAAQVVKFEPPQPVVIFPLEPGKTTTWTGKGALPGGGGGDNSVGMSTMTQLHTGVQTTDTSLASYQAYVFEQDQKWEIPGFANSDLAKAIKKQEEAAGGSSASNSTLGAAPKTAEEKKLEEDLKQKPGEGRSAVSAYFVPEVGIVRLRQEILLGNLNVVQVLKLKKVTLK
ncbi:MAG: hypothetical protein K8R88_12435 [Armatimonadetes bacterium]|nr:hypothetical protein [Armatimonadota bacterium]